MSKLTLTATIPIEYAGLRFDQAVSKLWPDYSRSFLTDCIVRGDCQLSSVVRKPKFKVSGGEQVTLDAKLEEQTSSEPENIAINEVYSDTDIIVINKPANLVVHPACGNWTGTLVNALLYHYPEVKNLPRAGIVHRLDKDTTGLMIVARTIKAHASLVEQLQERSISRIYTALVKGELITSGTIDAPIGRSRSSRQKMAISDAGKPAITDYKILQRYIGLTLLQLKLHTGRTHQIRVHCASIGHPVVGDATYARIIGQHKLWDKDYWLKIKDFPRQALHATELGVIHPTSGEKLHWKCDLPADMDELIQGLK